MRIAFTRAMTAVGLLCIGGLLGVEACSSGGMAGEESLSAGGGPGEAGGARLSSDDGDSPRARGGAPGAGGAVTDSDTDTDWSAGQAGAAAGERGGAGGRSGRGTGGAGGNRATGATDAGRGGMVNRDGDGGLSGRGAGGSASGGAAAAGGRAEIGGRNQAAGGGPSAGGSTGRGGAPSGGSTPVDAGTGGPRADGGACPYSGRVTYTLTRASNPTAEQETAYGLIETAMEKAIQYYNCYTDITKSLRIQYEPSVSTADGNANGSIRFGASKTYMDYRTAMHEISHTVGVGQASNWGSFISGGLFTGANAVAELNAINATLKTPVYAELHADTQHFWPYGINQQSEVKSEADLLLHCRMVMAIRKDLGVK